MHIRHISTRHASHPRTLRARTCTEADSLMRIHILPGSPTHANFKARHNTPTLRDNYVTHAFRSSLLMLPPDVLLWHIFLPHVITERCHVTFLSVVCKQWQQLFKTHEESVWRHLWTVRWPDAGTFCSSPSPFCVVSLSLLKTELPPQNIKQHYMHKNEKERLAGAQIRRQRHFERYELSLLVTLMFVILSFICVGKLFFPLFFCLSVCVLFLCVLSVFAFSSCSSVMSFILLYLLCYKEEVSK